MMCSKNINVTLYFVIEFFDHLLINAIYSCLLNTVSGICYSNKEELHVGKYIQCKFCNLNRLNIVYRFRDMRIFTQLINDFTQLLVIVFMVNTKGFLDIIIRKPTLNGVLDAL